MSRQADWSINVPVAGVGEGCLDADASADADGALGARTTVGAATIFVVDDETAIAGLVASILGRAGYTAIVCDTGDAAIQRLARELAGETSVRPAGSPGAVGCDRDVSTVRPVRHGRGIGCLITDVLMPGMKGPELAARARELQPDLPVAFVSGCPGAEELPVLDERTAFLPKPFTALELLATVERILGSREDGLALNCAG